MGKLGNPQETIHLLQKHDFHFRKKWGQNFLIDPHVLDKIVEAAEVGKEDFVLEIGPGIGTMTQYLCEWAGQVLAVEIDKNLIPILEETLKEYDNVEILQGDILKQDIRQIVENYKEGRSVKVVANLPYYITTPIIMRLLESGGTHEGAAGDKRIRGAFSCHTILCQTLSGSQCAAQLFYSAPRSGKRGDPSGLFG